MFNPDENIKIDFVPAGRTNRPGINMTPKYITIHNTGNNSATADAKAHSEYIKNPSTQVSWHFTVDDRDVVYQHLPLYEIAWHCGDGRYGAGNSQSVGIEICMHSTIDMDKAELNAAVLVAYLLKQLNIPIANVYQHNHWSGKNCPQVIRGRKNGWEDFITLIEEQHDRERKEASILEGRAINDMLDKAVENKVIMTKEFWVLALMGQKEVPTDYLKMLFENINRVIDSMKKTV